MTYVELLKGIEDQKRLKLDEIETSDLTDAERASVELHVRDTAIWSALRTLAHALDK